MSDQAALGYGCRACGRIAKTPQELLAAGCEGTHEPLVPSSDQAGRLAERLASLPVIAPDDDSLTRFVPFVQIAATDRDALLAELARVSRENEQLREALSDLLLHVPNGTASDPYKMRGYAALAAAGDGEAP